MPIASFVLIVLGLVWATLLAVLYYVFKLSYKVSPINHDGKLFYWFVSYNYFSDEVTGSGYAFLSSKGVDFPVLDAVQFLKDNFHGGLNHFTPVIIGYNPIPPSQFHDTYNKLDHNHQIHH